MSFILKVFLIFVFSFFLNFNSFAYTPVKSFKAYSEDSHKIWKKSFYRFAKARGVKKSILNKYIKNVQFDPNIIKKDRRQPEFSLNFFTYFKNTQNKERFNKGIEKYKQYKAKLKLIEKKYGVQPEYILAFWALETNFGSYLGEDDIIRSLATLSYDKRRSKFFSIQLVEALKMIQNKHVNKNKMKGSWAGAMGHFQFIPTTFKLYAIDGNKDKKINLWNIDDAFHSAANYLSSIGWKKNTDWGVEIKLPKNFDYFKTGRKNIYSKSLLIKKGVKFYKKTNINQGSIIVPAGHNGPAFFVGKNFNKILNWNNSEFYAIAIGLFAQKIKNNKFKLYNLPKNEKRLSYAELKKLQYVLLKKGFYKGTVDGVFGSGSKKALSLYEKSIGVVADGHIDKFVLNKLLGAKL